MLRYTAGKKDKHNMSESINLLLCVLQNIGEVARSDGGVRCDKVRLGNGKRFLYRRLVNDPFAPMTFR